MSQYTDELVDDIRDIDCSNLNPNEFSQIESYVSKSYCDEEIQLLLTKLKTLKLICLRVKRRRIK